MTKFNKIFFFDNTCDVSELSKLSDDLLIITFDYDSHKLLNSKEITHKISDNFLSTNDFHEIEENAYKFSKWSVLFKDLPFTYDGINIFNLYYRELHYFLVPFFKNFFEIKNIFKQFPDADFKIPKDLVPFFECFSNSFSVFTSDSNSTKNLPFESIKYDLNFFGKSIPIQISKQNYNKLKNFSENFLFKNILSTRKNNHDILLVEFDPIRFQNIFHASKNSQINLVLYNKRRPSIWNKKSFNIIKNSNSNIGSNITFSKNQKNEILSNIEYMKEELLAFYSDQKLSNFFSIDEISFWNAIKNFFQQQLSIWIENAIWEIESAKNCFSSYDLKCILIMYESGVTEQIAMKFAKDFNIPILLLSHGLSYETLEPPYLKRRTFDGVEPIQSDKILVWGKIQEDFLKKSGISAEKVVTIGAPIYDNIFQNKQISSSNTVLLATASPIQNMVNDLTIETLSKYEKTIKTVCKVILKHNKNLIIKMHPYMGELDVKPMISEFDSKISVVQNQDIMPLIQNCELFITIDLSTTIVEAQIHEKPVISISVKNYDFGLAKIFQLNPEINIELNNFESHLEKLFSDSHFSKSVIETGSNFINDYFSNQKSSSKELISFLEKTIK